MGAVYAFTMHDDSVLNRIITETIIIPKICKIQTNEIHKWRSLWDTGATRSSISKRVVDSLQLIPIGYGGIITAGGEVQINAYLIDMVLPNSVVIQNIVVTCPKIDTDIDVIIGMDVMKHGDLSLSFANGQTTFSFAVPSVEPIDFVKKYNAK